MNDVGPLKKFPKTGKKTSIWQVYVAQLCSHRFTAKCKTALTTCFLQEKKTQTTRNKTAFVCVCVSNLRYRASPLTLIRTTERRCYSVPFAISAKRRRVHLPPFSLLSAKPEHTSILSLSFSGCQLIFPSLSIHAAPPPHPPHAAWLCCCQCS